MANFYTAKKEIGGRTYVAQFNGISAALKAVGNTSLEKLSKYLFDNVIVEPKGLTADDFDSLDEFNEVVAFAREVMQGNFREAEVEKPTNKGSKG